MTRPTAPDSVLILRAAGSLTLILSYAVFRVPEFTVPPVELAITWVAGVFAIWLFERAASELYLRQRVGRAPEWPDEIELVIAEARHAAMAPVVDRGEITEQLFTHDILCEPTPPRGTPLPTMAELEARGKAINMQAHAENSYVGRHRAPAHLDRDRFGQFFGQL